MPRESSTPLCFRLTTQDRRLVETVAAFRGQTLSDYVREVVLERSTRIVEAEGSDKILRAIEESNSRLSEERLALYEGAIGQVAPRRP